MIFNTCERKYCTNVIYRPVPKPERKHIISGLKFDNNLKRYYVKSYIYVGNACVRECTTYINKHDILYIQRILCQISTLLSCRK